ncbi:hypothetical protein [Enterococcus sp. UD-01]|jgi:hypothetical protein|uniref:hypothetical protein n=1 Tax=Enterococcus sp. UD-01 TaxID=3373911 RepID=UPI00383957BC
MKKLVYPFIVIAGLTLAACGGKTTSESSTSTEKSTQTSKTTSTKESTTKTTTKATSNKAASSENTTSQTKASTTKTNEPQKQAEQVLNQLKTAFPNDALPQAILTSQTADYLSAATTPASDHNNFRVLYYAQPQPIGVNDTALNELNPIASFEKKTYGSAEEAAAAVNQIIDNNGMKVDLGYGITGYQQGAAGSSYLSWQEGNWSLVVRASNIEGEKAEPLAKEAVAYLEKAMLPAPQNVGQITLTTNTDNQYQNNSVVWQKGNNVYTIQHFDSIQALKMAVSTN